MEEPKTITIKIKSEDKIIKEKFLIYDKVEAHSMDQIIRDLVKQTKGEMNLPVDEIQVNIKWTMIE